MATFIVSITGQIRSLKTLKIGNLVEICRGTNRDVDISRATFALSEFILSLCGLIDFEMVNPMLALPQTVFEHLGPSLRRLCYNGIQCPHPMIPHNVDGSVRKFPLSAEDVQGISDFCSGVPSLTLAMLIVHDMPYPFLSALSNFPSLQSLSLHVKTAKNRDEVVAPNYLSRDIKMVTALVQYLFDNKKGCPFRQIDILLGFYSNARERPEMHFSCYKTGEGELVVEDNRADADAYWFRAYLYDGDIDEWETAMAEADKRMALLNDDGEEDEMASLFRSPSQSNN
ncbi:hypothetical protein IFR05_014463 [Cadophora sp. M221]|nr:hypothetical protein IFR05_014463 [Cadophora sp. M221]